MAKRHGKGSLDYSEHQPLGRIASLLTNTQFNYTNLSQSLGVLCKCLHADAAALFRMKYEESQNNRWVTELVGTSSSEGVIEWPQNLGSLPGAVWSALEKREIFLSEDRLFNSQQNESKILFLPVFLDDHLSCVITLLDLERDCLAKCGDTFLRALISIFELWVSKMKEIKKFDDLIDFLPNPTSGVDINGIATIWNPAQERLTGFEASRILGKGEYEYALPFYGMRRPVACNLILHPDSKWEATYAEYRKEGDVVYNQVFIPAMMGAGVFLTGTIKRMRDINGRICGSIHIIRDVTRERVMESELHRSESMFRTITDYAGLGIALFGKEKALYYNERLQNLLGVFGREVTLGDLVETVHSEDHNEIRSRLDMMFAGIEKGPLRLDLRVKIGDVDRYYNSYAQVLDYQGNPAIYFVLDDTTEQKELAQRARLNELKLYHEGRLTSLGIMAAGIAHELNQPLNTIRVITDGFLFGRDKGWASNPDELHESMEMISNQVMRMSEVIQNIRGFAREDREQGLVDVDVNHAIENVFFMIGRQFEAHDIRVHKKLARSMSTVKAHLNRIEQVIMNLLVNAQQALDACHRDRKELWINTGTKGKLAYIEVADNATGISKDLIEKIFDPFFTTKEVGEGTGLGLTICKSIVTEFKGSIEVVNNEHGGATFLVMLPFLGG